MKKLSFIIVILLFTSNLFASSETTNHYRSKGYDGNSFNYVQGNINFMVYQDGEFDFFIAHDGFSVDFDFGAVNITYNSGYNYDGYVQYDDYGAIVQIEDTPIYYDYYGRVSQIGNTYIHYRNRRIVRFGGLYVHFNSYGYYDYCTGYINPFNRHYVYRPYFNYYMRPHFDYCVVSYRPYRQYYRPIRHRFDRNNRYRRLDSRRRIATSHRSSRATRKVVPQRVRNTRTERVAKARNTRRTNTSRTTRGTSARSSRAVKSNRTTRGTSARSSRAVKPNRTTRDTSARSSRAVKPNRTTRGTSARSSRAVKSNRTTRGTSARSSRAVKSNRSRSTKRMSTSRSSRR